MRRSSRDRPESTPSRAHEVQIHLASQECPAAQRQAWDWLWRRLLGPKPPDHGPMSNATVGEPTGAQESHP